MPQIELICERCNKTYTRWPCRIKKGSRFCSRKCMETGLTREEWKDQWYSTHKNHMRVQHREYMQRPENKAKHSERGKIRSRNIKQEVIDAYGGNICSCDHNGVPCGEKPIEFLAIDHINGEGKERKHEGGYRFYQQLKRLNFPPGFRVLCHNCNSSLGFFGYCPNSNTESQSLWHHK